MSRRRGRGSRVAAPPPALPSSVAPTPPPPPPPLSHAATSDHHSLAMPRREGRGSHASSSAAPQPSSSSTLAPTSPPSPTLASASLPISSTPPPPPPPPSHAAPRPKIRGKDLPHPVSGTASETPEPISKFQEQAPISPRRDPPRRNPPRASRAGWTKADHHQLVKSSSVTGGPTTLPLDVALSSIARPKIRFVTRHDEHAAKDQEEGADKLKRNHSITFKGIDNQKAGSISNLKELAVVYDEEMTLHNTPEYMTLKAAKELVEIPERLTKIMDKIVKENLQDRFDLFKPDEAPTKSLLAVHGMDHVKEIESLWLKSAKERKELAARQSDVYYSQGSSRAAFLAAGSAIKASTLVAEGMYKHSFAIVRPPGHHAGKQGPSGFCLLNNVAVATAHVINKYEKKKVVVLDFDIHHGNGTQNIFYEDNKVLFISIHRYDTVFYPGTVDGTLDYVGSGSGRGFNVNCCLPEQNAADEDYFAIFEDIVLPLIENYDPDMILISAGFDAVTDDGVGDCRMTPNGYATLIDMVMRFGSLVLVLEGGYKRDALAQCAVACIKVLSGDKSGVLTERTGLPMRSTLDMIKLTKEKLSEVWKIFREDHEKSSVVEVANEDASLVKNIGKSFRLSAVESKHGDKARDAHDEAMFGVPTTSSVDTETDGDQLKTNNEDRKVEDIEAGPSSSLISDKKGSWRERAQKLRQDSNT